MATGNKFNIFFYDLGRGFHNLDAGGHVLKVYLATAASAPDAEADAIKANVAEFAGGTGYTAGGADTQNTWTRSGAICTLGGTDIVWTAGAADWAAFQFAVMYNDTQTSPADPLVAWWAEPAPVTLGNGETYTFDMSAAVIATGS
ncbi:MAG TPA: hypothetical protein VLZ09_08795 [Gaiellaceae bacterium]|nr:hypothetical protein [Gaiellaceae bacterium]